MGFIYYFENIVNHKKYIGKTTRNPQIRYSQHFYQIDDGTVFHNALKKYGKENFLFYVIGEFPDEELNKKEEFYIRYFNSHWKDGYGYNMSYGGENSPDVTYRPVRAYPLNEDGYPIYEQKITFKSISSAHEYLKNKYKKNFNIPNIVAICQGKKYSIFNYTFCYIDENNEDIPTGYKGYLTQKEARQNNIKKCHDAVSIPIVLISPWDEEFYYDSIKQACREHHIDSKTINKILDKDIEIASGPNKGWKARRNINESKIVKE